MPDIVDDLWRCDEVQNFFKSLKNTEDLKILAGFANIDYEKEKDVSDFDEKHKKLKNLLRPNPFSTKSKSEFFMEIVDRVIQIKAIKSSSMDANFKQAFVSNNKLIDALLKLPNHELNLIKAMEDSYQKYPDNEARALPTMAKNTFNRISTKREELVGIVKRKSLEIMIKNPMYEGKYSDKQYFSNQRNIANALFAREMKKRGEVAERREKEPEPGSLSPKPSSSGNTPEKHKKNGQRRTDLLTR